MRSIKDIFSDRNYFLNLLCTFLSQIFTAASLLILTPKIFHTLGASGFSEYSIILNSVLICSIFDFGMNQGILRRSIRERNNLDILFNTVLIFYIFVGLASFILFLLLTKIGILHTVPFSTNGIFIIILFSVQTILINFFDVIIQATQKIFLAKIFRIIKTIIEFACILFFIRSSSLYFILGITLVVNFMYLILLIGYILITHDIRLSLMKFRLSNLIDHLRYSFWYFITALSVILVFNTQIYILNNTLSVEELSKYLLFAKIFEIIRISIANFTTVLIPRIIKTEFESNHHSVLVLYKQSFVRLAMLLVIVLFVLLLFGRYLFIYWTKSQLVFDYKLFYLFLFYNILILIDNVSALYLAALKYNRLPTIVSIGQGAIVVVCSFFFIRYYGVYGVLIGSIIALVITNLFFNPLYLLKQLRFGKSA